MSVHGGYALMHGYSAAEWQSLFVAEVGASAALTGLLFVAISINLAQILQGAGLSGRAGEAMVLLLAVLVVSTLALVPGQSATALGAELLVAGLVVWTGVVTIHVRAVRGQVGPSSGVLAGRIVLAQTAVLPLLVAGVSLLLGAGGGLYWLVPGVLFCLVVAVLNAWVLLIEIVR
jgi:modulator of FtsH protease